MSGGEEGSIAAPGTAWASPDRRAGRRAARAARRRWLCVVLVCGIGRIGRIHHRSRGPEGARPRVRAATCASAIAREHDAGPGRSAGAAQRRRCPRGGAHGAAQVAPVSACRPLGTARSLVGHGAGMKRTHHRSPSTKRPSPAGVGACDGHDFRSFEPGSEDLRTRRMRSVRVAPVPPRHRDRARLRTAAHNIKLHRTALRAAAEFGVVPAEAAPDMQWTRRAS